ncbi:hypothetical protein D3C80_901930 [compost metagenome]
MACMTANNGKRFYAKLFSFGQAHQGEGCGTIRNRGRIGSGDSAAFTEGRLEIRYLFRLGAGWLLIAVKLCNTDQLFREIACLGSFECARE